MSTTRRLRELDELRAQFGPGTGERKRALLDALGKARLPTAAAVARLHECLCYLRAYPDDRELLAAVTAMLDGFHRRGDLRRWRRALADSGIAGTSLRFSFFADTARWLSRRLPGALRVVWEGFANEDLLAQRLPLLATWSETPGLDEVDLSARQWVRRLAGPDTSDADFLLARCERIGRTAGEREAWFEELDLEFELDLAPEHGAPSRTRAALAGGPVHFQTGPLRRARPDLRAELRRRSRVVAVDRREGARLIALAREAMVLRHRDLDAFAYADERDVRLFDQGDGLEFAVMGVRPERRLLLESVYAYLTLKNGVPIGYVLTSGLFGSSEIAYNVFDPWRGGEAAAIYGRVLAVTHELYGSDTFAVFPYQLGGDGNDEGLASGAWWFYQKLGFRSREPDVLATMERELATMRRRPGHRTSRAVLARLAEHTVFWSTDRARDDVIGVFAIGNVGLAITDLLARRFGSDRERGERVAAAEAAALCGVRGWRRWPAPEALWWRRWAPLVLLLGVETWTAAERRDLVAVVRAKGGRREADYVQRLDAHPKLRAALRRLARRQA